MKLTHRNNNKKNRYTIIVPVLTIIGIAIIIIISTNYEENWTYNWDEIRTEIKDSIKISEIRGITSGVGGMGSSTIDEVNRRRWIMKNATESELLQLIKYPNGTIKAIAYEGLIRKKEFKNKTELTLNAIKDTTYLVDYQFGCTGKQMRIGEYLVINVLNFDGLYPPSPEMLNDYGISQSNKEKILTEYRNQ